MIASVTLAPERSIAALKVSSWRLMASGPFDLTGPRASGTHWGDAELHRLRGDLLGRLPSNDCIEVETCFRTALSVAREQGTRGFELRAAVSLARFLIAQGRRDQARELLVPVYGWFTEGFDTTDLKEAKALLESLGA